MEVIRKEFSGKGKLTGLELGDLIRDDEGGEGRIQWEVLDPVFPGKVGIYRGERKVLEERARQARKWLWEREEEHVVAVLHGGVCSTHSPFFRILQPLSTLLVSQ